MMMSCSLAPRERSCRVEDIAEAWAPGSGSGSGTPELTVAVGQVGSVFLSSKLFARPVTKWQEL